MTITFDMSPEEAKKLSRAATWRARRLYGPNWLTKCYWYLALPLTIVAIGLFFDNLAAAALSAVVSVALGRLANDLYRRLYSKKERLDPAPRYAGEWTVQLEEDGLLFKSKLVEHKYTWGYFRFADVTDDYVYLCASQTSRVTIPKRAFATKADLTAFVADADHRIQQAQHPAPVTEPR